MSGAALTEAADPSTAPARLRQIAGLAPWRDRTLAVHAEATARRVHDAVMRNPSLPLDSLRATLLDRETPLRWTLGAWHNPAVPLLLLSEPDAGYLDAALRALLWHEQRAGLRPSGTETLVDEVAWWAAWGRHGRSHAPSLRCRDFARHLASLFGLPWPVGEQG